MQHDNGIVAENHEYHNKKEQNHLDQDESTETILQNSENEMHNIHDMHEIVVDNGGKITIDELKKGYCRREELISNQQKISEQKEHLQNKAKIIAQSADALAQMINTHIPAEPNPLLAETDPATYQYMIDLRQKALAIIDNFIDVGRYPNNIAIEYENESLAKKLESENEKLENMFPQTKDPIQRESFFQNIFAIGNKFGFQEEEIKNIVDHRLLALAYYAQLGVKSQKISNDVYNKAIRKPAVTISSKGKKYHNQHQIKSQEQAIKKLHKTGSLYDALEVDFI